MAFTHIQGNSVLGSTVTTKNLVLGAAPTLGNIVCVGFAASVAVTGLTVVDGNGNAYVVSPNSPSTFQSPAGQVWMAYLLSAPANASATITLTWVTAATPVIFADEFSVTGGTAAFDTDIPANSNIAGTAINTPSITPAGAGELLYAMAAAGGTISSPTPGGTQGLWTGSAGAIAFGDMAEYDLSGASGATAVDFVQSSGKWSAMAMAIKLAGAATTPFAYLEPVADNQQSNDVNFSVMQEADDFPTALPPPNPVTPSDGFQPIYADYIWLGGDE